MFRPLLQAAQVALRYLEFSLKSYGGYPFLCVSGAILATSNPPSVVF